MIFTPQERQALLTLVTLLVLGQVVAFWEERRRAFPDRRLSAWLTRLENLRADTLGSGTPSAQASLFGPLAAGRGCEGAPGRSGDPAIGAGPAGTAPSATGVSGAEAAGVAAPGEGGPAGGGEGAEAFLSGGVHGAAAAGLGPPPVRVEPLAAAPPGVLEGGRVRINQASASELEQLAGIGPAMAGRILEERERGGPFLRAEDLLRVKGIGPKKLERLRTQIDFAPP